MKALFTIIVLFTAVALHAQNTKTSPANVLPHQEPTIANLRAETNNNGINLQWRALHGNNIERYQVQKSTLGSNFSSIGAISANRMTPAKYSFHDGSPIYGKNYYRLVAVENNGNRAYSNIIVANNGVTNTQMRVLPNPVVNGNLHVQFYNFEKGRYNISLFSNAGTRIMANTRTFPEGRSSHEIALPGYLPAGTYFLQVTNGNTVFNQQVFVK